jgi:hypothetical protein
LPICDDPNEESVFDRCEKMVDPEVIDAVDSEVVLDYRYDDCESEPESEEPRVPTRFSISGESNNTYDNVHSKFYFGMQRDHICAMYEFPVRRSKHPSTVDLVNPFQTKRRGRAT